MARRLVVAALVVVAFATGVLYRPAPAAAQASALTADRCSAEDDDDDSGGGLGSGLGGAASATVTTKPENDGEDGVCSSLLDDISPGPDPGAAPTSHYDIGYDQGGTCACLARRVTGWVTGALFGASTWLVRIGLGIINWAMEFQFARLLLAPAKALASAYQHRVIDQSGLGALFIFLAVCWGGLLALTGKLGRGASEVGVSLLIGAIATTIWTNPADSLTSGLEFTAGVAGEVAAVGTGVSPDNVGEDGKLGAPMAAAIHKAFVEHPHQILSWGRLIPEGDSCRGVYDAAVASGPWGTSSKPRVAMKEAGCRAEDKFNRDPSNDRLFAALALLLASGLVIVLLVTVAAVVVMAQLEIMVAIVTWPFGALFGTLAGRGRSLFWRWIGSTVLAFTKVIVMMLLLSLTLTAVSAILAATTTEKLLVQMGTIVIVVVLAIVKRGQFLKGGQRAVNAWTSRMAGARVGPASGSGWLGAAGAGAGAGAALGKAQKAVHRNQDRRHDRAMLALGQERNALAAANTTQAVGPASYTDQRVQNLILVLSGERDERDTNPPPPPTTWEAPPRTEPAGLSA